MPKQYDPDLVDAVKAALDEGKTPMDILDAGEIDITSEPLMAIIADGGEHGWDNIKGEDLLGDDDDEVASSDEAEVALADAAMKEASFPDADDDGAVSEVAEEQAAEIEKKAKKPTRRKAKSPATARGKKQPNTKQSKVMNRARRKRKGGNPAMNRMRLLMDMKKKHPEFEYRWVLDRPGRIRAMEADDYDIVTDAHIDEGNGGNVTAVAGTNHYHADNMVLMRKYKPWYIDDQEDKLAEGREFESQINKGKNAGGSSLVDQVGPKEMLDELKNSGLDTSNTYVPAGEKNRVGVS